ncbi:MAG: hypothetical protein AAF198_06195 [Pseudomonadota bacterium]
MKKIIIITITLFLAGVANASDFKLADFRILKADKFADEHGMHFISYEHKTEPGIRLIALNTLKLANLKVFKKLYPGEELAEFELPTEHYEAAARYHAASMGCAVSGNLEEFLKRRFTYSISC